MNFVHFYFYAIKLYFVIKCDIIYTWKENNNSNVKNYKIGTIEGLKEYILKEANLTRIIKDY